MIPKTFRLSCLCCLIFLALSWPAPAATNVPPVIPDRYLLVLDVSAPMRPRAAAVQQAVTSLLVSGFQGQIRDGDQIGIWTFNDQLHSGDFELLTWSGSDRNDLTRQVLNFVNALTYANETRFEKVRPELLAVVKESRRITVILMSDGDEVIQGTPFDLSISKYFQENAAELKVRKAPIITVMRGYNGQLIGHKISYPPWPLELPFFPAEPEPVSIPEPKAVSTPSNGLLKTLVTTNKGPIVYAEPLIVSGGDRPARKASPLPVETNAILTPTTPLNQPAAKIPIEAGNLDQTRSNRGLEAAASSTPDKPANTSGSSSATGADEGGDGTFWSPVKLIGVVVLGLAVVGGVVWLLRRKPRSTGHTSLITRSMDEPDDSRR